MEEMTCAHNVASEPQKASTSMELVVGQAVKFVDSVRRVRDALVTHIHDNGMSMEEFKKLYGGFPCINLVVVMLEEDRRDPYGQQTEHHTSVSYRTSAYEVAGGYFYYLPEDLK